ncbi:integrase-like protein [Yoonia sediminilitoris]|uniref:Integrase-like protein n=1 Tax=Yoonia sediminilitoris TaxID=1286148 RepID=A0A2T6KBY2_9RHOB|nr:integrase-like protein [Yoonia sediminilitoris]
MERSHRYDGQEFYQLLSYKGDVDLEAKLDEWERFYNFHRPPGAHKGKTPYEALREKLESRNLMSREQPHLEKRDGLRSDSGPNIICDIIDANVHCHVSADHRGCD